MPKDLKRKTKPNGHHSMKKKIQKLIGARNKKLKTNGRGARK